MSTIPPSNPLAYVGIKETNPPQRYFATRAPNANDYKIYDIGDIWIDTAHLDAYIMVERRPPVAQWNLMAAGTAELIYLTGDSGGQVSPDMGQNINILGGTGITVAGNPATNTLTINSSSTGFTWSEITSPTQTIAVQNGYVVNRPAGVAFTLPATANMGDTFIILPLSGLWSISQNPGQIIYVGNDNTTIGIGGSISATQAGDSVEVVCMQNNISFRVKDSMGNLTVV